MTTIALIIVISLALLALFLWGAIYRLSHLTLRMEELTKRMEIYNCTRVIHGKCQVKNNTIQEPTKEKPWGIAYMDAKKENTTFVAIGESVYPGVPPGGNCRIKIPRGKNK